MVLSLSLITSLSVLWYSEYPYSESQSTWWLRQSLYSSQTPWWYSYYPSTHHSLSGGPQTIPILITVYLVAKTIPILITVSIVVPRLSLYSSESAWWYSDYPYTHHSLPGGTQSIPILITVSLWYSNNLYIHHSFPGGPQTIPIHITVSFVVLRLSLISSQSLWWHSDYSYTHHNLPGGSDNPYTHHSLPGGTQKISVRFTVSLVVLRIPLYSSLSPWWYSDYPYAHHRLPYDT